tara:strand:+ start:1125 stop:1355 length:231 start_codon:yes stop_codon:yes gene_type:complete
MPTVRSSEATIDALRNAGLLINDAIHTVTIWIGNNNGADYSDSAKAEHLARVTELDTDAIQALLATAKTWDGTASS